MLRLKGPDLQWWSAIKQRKKQTAENAPGWHPVDHFTKLNAPLDGAGMEREEGGRAPTKSQEVKSSHVI